MTTGFPVDPQTAPAVTAWELFRCCLLRTLLSYNPAAGPQGRSELYPDLAAAPPTVSADGLTWKFQLRTGLDYAPPLSRVPIVASDVVRALEREARLRSAAYPYYYSVIRGFGNYRRGRVSSIVGLETPDAHTLVVRLTQPTSDLGYRFAMPATAPIPANPFHPGAPLGIATGHDLGYGQFLVSSGPYMYAGSAKMNFSQPAREQRPVVAFVPGQTIRLGRNPSWHAATDPLRPAHVNGIQIQLGGTTRSVAHEVNHGSVDFVLSGWGSPEGQLSSYRSDPSLRARVHQFPADSLTFVPMNLARPPFDDIHVRRAVVFAIDEAGLTQTRTSVLHQPAFPPIRAVRATHLLPDALEGNLLLGFNPFATGSRAEAIHRAHQEMSASRYDPDHDGLCDAPACADVTNAFLDIDPMPRLAQTIANDLSQIGIHVEGIPYAHGPALRRAMRPAGRASLYTAGAWLSDYPDPSTLFVSSLYGPSITSATDLNFSMMGATRSELARWGYPVTTVPSVDQRIRDCLSMTGTDRTICWTMLDRYLMLRVVPWVPVLSEVRQLVTSARIHHFLFDPWTGLPAPDQIVIDR